MQSSKPAAGVRARCVAVLAWLALSLMFTPAVSACEDCGQVACESSAQSWDFFTNYGNYMPRTHCLQTADGGSDWPWIIALIALTAGVVVAYGRIFIFWTRCYLDEERKDRNRKLMELACIFLFCAICGYALHIVIFFWPVYRLLAFCLLALNIWSWKFAWNLQPFQISFKANRLQRELNESLVRTNSELASKNSQLTEQQNLLLSQTNQLRQQNEELARTRQQLEASVAELTQANKDLDGFVYVASHDLKSPLRGINALATFICDEIGDTASDQVKADLETMAERVNRMDTLLDDLLQYSRSGRKNFPPETFDAVEEVKQAAEILACPTGITVQVNGPPVQVFGAVVPFTGVARNLIDNAFKHHDRETGHIEIDVQELAAEGVVEVRITDDGPGIDPRFHERVFDMFQTLKPRDQVEGSGMGLAIVKRNIEAHGGSISLSSNGRGACFRFTWPLSVASDTQNELSIQKV